VSSRLGAGTTFEIRLPVTFGLLTVSVLVTNGQRYCIPASQVINIENASPTKSAKRASSTNIVELSELLGYARKKSGRKVRKLVTFQAAAANGSAAKNLVRRGASHCAAKLGAQCTLKSCGPRPATSSMPRRRLSKAAPA